MELVGESERRSSSRNVEGDDQAGVHRDRVQRAGHRGQGLGRQ
jgi:hypothetical protein